MTIELKPEQEQLVEDALRSGAYRSKEDVIERALAVLHEQDEWLTVDRSDIDARVRNGIAQLERGEGIAEDELDEYLERLKAQ